MVHLRVRGQERQEIVLWAGKQNTSPEYEKRVQARAKGGGLEAEINPQRIQIRGPNVPGIHHHATA